MSILCAMGGHEAGGEQVYNGGYYFARCTRCSRDMVRCGAAWQMVPSGHRVVWKSGRHHHSVEPSYARVLPVLHANANLPALPTPFASWRRDMVPLPGDKRSAAAAAPASEREEPQYPRLLIVAAIVGAGLQLLLSLGSARGPS